MGIALLGQMLTVPSPLSATATAVFATTAQVQVRAIEEPHRLRTHGAAHPSHTTRTKRFLPFMGRQNSMNQ